MPPHRVYFTDIYAKTHEERLAESMAHAAEELKNRYGLELEYKQHLADKMKLLETERTKVQASLDEYSRGRGGKSGGGAGDNTAALLAVVANAGGDIAAETGKASQRKLEAQAGVQARYRLSSGQTSAVGSASDAIASSVDATSRTAGDIDRQIVAALDKIPDGTFTPGDDAAKTATAELYSRLDSALRAASPNVYGSDPTGGTRLAAAIAAKTGVNAAYVDSAEVIADEKLAIAKEQKIVGATATGTSARAASLAEAALGGKLGSANKEEADAVAKWISSPGGAAYLSALQTGGDYQGALEAAAKRIGVPDDVKGAGALEQEVFQVEVGEGKGDAPGALRDIRAILNSSGASFDIVKFFDAGFLDLYGRSKSLEAESKKTFGDISDQFERLRGGVPTQEDVRRRGAEIYEPLAPSTRSDRRAAGARLEEARMEEARTPGTLRTPSKAGDVDDFLATRLTAADVPQEKRITGGASAAAVRAGPLYGRGDDKSEAFRMYSNVKGKQLRDTSPKGLVQHAADLSGGDVDKRDAILQGYYQYSLGDMRALKVKKSEERLGDVAAPKESPIGFEETKGVF